MRESHDRVRAAIRHAGLEFPIERITVSLAYRPAEGEDFRLARSGDERKYFMSKRLKGEKKS